MTLSFTAVDDKSQWRDFACDLLCLEDALDFLTAIASERHIIQKVYIVDEGKRTELPSEAFDGHPISASIRKLEKEWKKALKKPVRLFNESEQLRQEIICRRIKIYDNKIDSIEVLIHHFEELRRRVDEVRLSSVQRNDLTDHYERTIANYLYMLGKTKTDRYTAQAKLKQLVS